MGFKKFFTQKVLIIAAILIVALIAFAVYWLNILNVAHSSFENYYNFRGCVQLIEKTDTYATCRISSGKIIKIVKFQDKWYLDGDLPPNW